MLAKAFRLTGKDINFLTHKRQFIPWGLFNFFYVRQYPNRKFNQISVNIPLKFDKRATQRRIVKRAIIQFIEEKSLIHKQINGKFYKIFVFLNKKSAPELAKKFASEKKKDTIQYIVKKFTIARSNLLNNIK